MCEEEKAALKAENTSLKAKVEHVSACSESPSQVCFQVKSVSKAKPFVFCLQLMSGADELKHEVMANKVELVEKEAMLARKDAELVEKDAEIAALKARVVELKDEVVRENDEWEYVLKNVLKMP